MSLNYDFSGWVTRNDIRCSDGRTIRQDAFAHQDGTTVPLVLAHLHNDFDNVVGKVLLENREDGVYGYASFNDTEKGRISKEQVRHGDINSLSIYANQLDQSDSGDVFHGMIREVSLVLAGANPGARIDSVVMAHSGDIVEDEAIIFTGNEISLAHADDEDEEENNMKTKQEEIFESMTDEQKDLVYFMIGEALNDASDTAKHSDIDAEDDEYDDDDEEIEIIDDDDEDDDEDEDEIEGEEEMKHNVFDNDRQGNVISHDDMKVIMKDAKAMGSLKESVLQHMEDGVLQHAFPENEDGTVQEYGMANIHWLFPEAKLMNNPPDFIKRDTGWVAKVMNGTHHTPFSRIKSQFADITADEARAKGYMKGKQKKEEVFTLLKRTTSPQTIYKKQKLDRDDVIDITDFDVVAWIKAEMRMMLDEELARAVLIGDGRNPDDDDHISEEHIRPIFNDADLYAVKVPVQVKNGADESAKAKAFIRAALKSRKEYKGSGNPTLFTTEDMLADLLLLEDGIGHLLYPSEQALATTLRVSSIVTVPVMENQLTHHKEGGEGPLIEKPLAGLIVNLNDYNIGADKGGAVNMFDDFDIDVNRMKYLIETRCSGALIKPYSALVLYIDEADA